MEKDIFVTLENNNVLVTVKKVTPLGFSITYFDKRTSRTITYKRDNLEAANELAIDLFNKEEMIY